MTDLAGLIKPLMWKDRYGTWSNTSFNSEARIAGHLFLIAADTDDPDFEAVVAEKKAAAQAHHVSTMLAGLDTDKIARLVETSQGMKKIVEELQGAMEHGTWRDEKGMRIKDTPEWVRFYNALAAFKEGAT